MKIKTFITVLLLAISLSSCTPAVTAIPTETAMPTALIPIPSATPTFLPTPTTSENFSNELKCIYPEEIQSSPALNSTLLTSDGISNNIELWNLETNKKIVLGRVVILSGAISNYQKVALIDADKHQLKIVSPEGAILSTVSAPKNWVEILDWPDSGHLLISNMPFLQDGGWDPPSSTISLDLDSGKNVEFMPRYPDIYAYISGPPGFGSYSYSLTAYDSTLTRVLYPAENQDSSFIVLWDISNHKEIARIQTDFPFGDVQWKKDATAFIVSAPPSYTDWQGKVHKNVSDQLPDVGGNELFLVSRDGEIKRLTYLTTKYVVNEYALSWSPNKENIAFWMKIGTDTPEWQLAILETTTGKITSYCINNDEGSLPIIWASDGNQLISTIAKKDGANSEFILIDTQKNKSAIWSVKNQVVLGWLDKNR